MEIYVYLDIVTELNYHVTVTMERTVQRRVHLSMKRVFTLKQETYLKKVEKSR